MLHKTLNIRGTLTSLDTPLVMGILNVTPDSFYADSRKQTEVAIEERIQAILSEGGQIIDLGGYSSRPDAAEVSPEEEMKRLAFALKILVSKLKKNQITEIAAVIAFSAIQNNDKIGVIFFSDKIEKFIPPKKGRTHILHIIRELIDFYPEDRQTNIEQALEYVTSSIKKRCT